MSKTTDRKHLYRDGDDLASLCEEVRSLCKVAIENDLQIDHNVQDRVVSCLFAVLSFTTTGLENSDFFTRQSANLSAIIPEFSTLSFKETQGIVRGIKILRRHLIDSLRNSYDEIDQATLSRIHSILDDTVIDLLDLAGSSIEGKKGKPATRNASSYKVGDRFEALLASNMLGCIITHFDGRVIEANDKFLDMLGYSRTELEAGKVKWDQLTPNEWKSADEAIIKGIEESGYSPPTRKEYIKKDGSRLPVLVGASSIKGEELGNAAAVILDLSDQVKVENDLLKAKLVAEEASNVKTEFLANMSHEIRTPLAIIIGFAEILLQGSSNQDEQTSHLNKIIENGRHLTTVVDDILSFSKLEKGTLNLQKEFFDTDLFLQNVIKDFEQAALAKKIKLQLETKGNLPSKVRTDPGCLRQILNKLISNAIKFTSEGLVKVSTSVHKKNEAYFWSIDISDNGIGIGEDDFYRLFKPFSQVDGSFTREFGGTGLGLIIAKKLAEKIEGQVFLKKSRLGQGSTFSVSIAIEIDPESNKARASVKKQVRPRLLEGRSILLAEDDRENQYVFKLLFESTGANLTIVEDGKTAVEQALTGDFDVVLMDIQMPILDGNQATSSLRSQGYKKPIFALTAHALIEDRRRSMACGFDQYFTKPINIREVIDSIRLA